MKKIDKKPLFADMRAVKTASGGRKPEAAAGRNALSTRVIAVVALLVLSTQIHAKTRDRGSDAGGLLRTGDAANLTSAEIEAKFRPFLEERANNRRDGARAGRTPGRASRPTEKDLFAMARAWDGLTPEFHALYKEAMSIPKGYGSFVSPMGKFRVFYTTEGVDRVDPTDAIGYGVKGQPSAWRARNPSPNGVPDYIDEAAFALDSAWSMIIDRFGFPEPVNAASPDGSAEQYPVLITYMEEYGVTIPETARLTPGFASHIELNSDWSDPIWGDYSKYPLDALRVTCAHEFLHAIQYAMVWTIDLDFIPYGWLEGAAVLMEEIAFPDINDYLQYISRYFSSPKVTFLDDNNIYMNSILFKYLYEKTNPADSIGLVKAVHDNNKAQRQLNFHRNIEQASQERAGKSWAEILNGFHAESYFTKRRARRPWAFVTDAELMDSWNVPTAMAASPETKTVRPYSVEFFRYAPRPEHSDTLVLTVSGQRDQSSSAAGKPWGASALVMESGDSVGIVPVPMGQNGAGRLVLPDWKEKSGCLLVVTNATKSASRSVTVTIGDASAPIDTAGPADSTLSIYPNVINISSAKPLRVSGGDVTNVKIFTLNGRLMAHYNGNGANSAAFKKSQNSAVEWYPGRRLAPGVYYISAASTNTATGERSVRKGKFMILP